jgi:hypothetical protein
MTPTASTPAIIPLCIELGGILTSVKGAVDEQA